MVFGHVHMDALFIKARIMLSDPNLFSTGGGPDLVTKSPEIYVHVLLNRKERGQSHLYSPFPPVPNQPNIPIGKFVDTHFLLCTQPKP